MSATPFTRKQAAVACGVVAASLTLIAQATSATASKPDPGPLATAGQNQVAAQAVSRDFGISTAQAADRLRAERGQDLLADRLTRNLGSRDTAGAYIDHSSGDLVVTVTDRASAQAVRRAGATPQRVQYSSALLDNAQQSLDTFARTDGAGAIQSWYVDVPTNTLVVNRLAGARGVDTREFLAEARSLGGLVDIETTTAKATSAAYLYGGQQVNMSNGYICSLGFNARTSSGASIFLTAGHCAEGNPTFSRNGVTLGATRGYSFPNNDYASVNINNPSYWNPQGAVDMYNGYARTVTGYSKAAVGSSLCKSGRTTGWTCGRIQAYNQTVNYGGGDIVYGLVRHSACVEQGDSGGSNMTGNRAQGLSSGGQLYQSGGRLVCGQKVGQPNVSFHQPVGEALNRYNATLITG